MWGKTKKKKNSGMRFEVAVSTLVKTKTTHAGIVLPPRRPAGTDVTRRSWEKSDDGRHRRRCSCSRALRCANAHGTCRSATVGAPPTHVKNIAKTVKIRHDNIHGWPDDALATTLLQCFALWLLVACEITSTLTSNATGHIHMEGISLSQHQCSNLCDYTV